MVLRCIVQEGSLRDLLFWGQPLGDLMAAGTGSAQGEVGMEGG